LETINAIFELFARRDNVRIQLYMIDNNVLKRHGGLKLNIEED
jgi:hypothetical protein